MVLLAAVSLEATWH